MAKSGFDPFDERLRNKVKRRKPEEVAADQRNWNDRIDKHFVRALCEYGNPDYIESAILFHFFEYDGEANLPASVLKRNTKAAMERLGYEKMMNENSKNGRWKLDGEFTFVYAKRGSPKISGNELKQALAP